MCIRDRSICDFFLWGCLKFKVFQSRLCDLNQLSQRIIEEDVQAILQAMLRTVIDRISIDLKNVSLSIGVISGMLFSNDEHD